MIPILRSCPVLPLRKLISVVLVSFYVLAGIIFFSPHVYAAGNMWTVNASGNSVTKVAPDGTIITYTGTGALPYGIAFDGTNMWTTNASDNSVTKVAPNGTMTTYPGTGSKPYGIAFDGTNMWTANANDDSVTKVAPNGTMTTYPGTGAGPIGIAFDGTNMWVANYDGGSVTKVAPNGTMTTYPGTGAGPYGIAFDGFTLLSLTGIASGTTAPTITLSTATSVTASTATINGSITATGGEDPDVTVYWGTTDASTTIASWDNSADLGTTSVAAFLKNLTGLTPNTTYYFTAKATNSAGTSWPTASFSFTTASPPIVVSLEPTSGSTYVPVDSNLVIQFSEPVQANENGVIGIVKLNEFDPEAGEEIFATFSPTDGQVTVDGSTVTIDLTNNLEYSTKYAVLILEGSFVGMKGNEILSLFMDKDSIWSFTTQAQGYLITNVPTGKSVVLSDTGEDVSDAESNYQTGYKTVTIKHGTRNLAKVVVNFSANRNWSGLKGESDLANKKSFIHLAEVEGATATHTLYVPGTSASHKVRICPNAASLTEVTADCAGGYEMADGERVGGSVATYSDGFWVVTYLLRTGGMEIAAAEETLAPVPAAGGSGLPPEAYQPPHVPAGGFRITINNGAAATAGREVTLKFNAGADIKKMAISPTLDFAGVGQEAYQPTKSWNLCSNSACPGGPYAVYAKFYTAWGQPSEIVSASITLDPKAKPADLQPQNNSQSLILDKGTVYVVISGKKYGFASQTAFLGLGYSFKYVIKGNSAPYPDGGIILSDPSQPHLSGSWIISDKTVYYVTDNGLIPVPSWSIFLSNGGKASFLIKANAADLKKPLLGLMEKNDSRVE